MRWGHDLATVPPLIAVDESPAGYSWQVALQQSPLPLYQPELYCQSSTAPDNASAANGAMSLNGLSQPRGPGQGIPSLNYSDLLLLDWGLIGGTTTDDIYDPYNLLTGNVKWSQERDIAGNDNNNRGPAAYSLTLNGGDNLSLCSLQASGGCTIGGSPVGGIGGFNPYALDEALTYDYLQINLSQKPQSLLITIPGGVTTPAGENYENGFFTTRTTNWTGKTLSWCMNDTLDPADAADWFGVQMGLAFAQNGAADVIDVIHFNGNLLFAKRISDVTTIIGSGTYNAATMGCMQLSESAGAFTVKISPGPGQAFGTWTPSTGSSTCTSPCVSWKYDGTGGTVYTGFTGQIINNSTSTANPGYAEFYGIKPR